VAAAAGGVELVIEVYLPTMQRPSHANLHRTAGVLLSGVFAVANLQQQRFGASVLSTDASG